MPKLLCVYCSSSDLIDAKYHAAAEELGRGMTARGWGLVYGGGGCVGIDGGAGPRGQSQRRLCRGRRIPEFM